VYQTTCGALATILMYIILLIYAINGFTLVVTDQTKSINKQVSFIDLDSFDGF
jgi:hypothetical protein